MVDGLPNGPSGSIFIARLALRSPPCERIDFEQDAVGDFLATFRQIEGPSICRWRLESPMGAIITSAALSIASKYASSRAMACL